MKLGRAEVWERRGRVLSFSEKATAGALGAGVPATDILVSPHQTTASLTIAGSKREILIPKPRQRNMPRLQRGSENWFQRRSRVAIQRCSHRVKVVVLDACGQLRDRLARVIAVEEQRQVA